MPYNVTYVLRKNCGDVMGKQTTKFTPERREVILYAISRGMTYSLSAQSAGISYSGYLGWMKRGEAEVEADEKWHELPADERIGDPPVITEYGIFYLDVKKAESDAVQRWVDRIQDAAEDDKHWHAAAWMLERRYPREYGQHTTVAGDPDNPLVMPVQPTIVEVRLTTDAYEASLQDEPEAED